MNLLAIPPVLTILGVTTGLVAAWEVRRELRWGLEQEATASAVSLAEFASALDPSSSESAGLMRWWAAAACFSRSNRLRSPTHARPGQLPAI